MLAEVTETTATGALKDMPTLKYQFKPRETTVDGSDGSNSHSRNEATSVYVLPPIRYPGPDPPEGWYVKIGGGANDFFERERWESTVPDLERWMRSDGDEKVADVLVEILTDLMPRTNFLTLIPKACVTTCTDDGELQCDALGREGRILGVSGCQGKAAGPADAIGEAVAREVFETACARSSRGRSNPSRRRRTTRSPRWTRARWRGETSRRSSISRGTSCGRERARWRRTTRRAWSSCGCSGRRSRRSWREASREPRRGSMPATRRRGRAESTTRSRRSRRASRSPTRGSTRRCRNGGSSRIGARTSSRSSWRDSGGSRPRAQGRPLK